MAGTKAASKAKKASVRTRPASRRLMSEDDIEIERMAALIDHYLDESDRLLRESREIRLPPAV